MTKKERAISIFKKYFPYLAIVIASMFSCFIYFLEGIAAGDDISFHLSMTNDVLYGFDHGYFGYSTNHLFFGGFALYNYGFYGPVTHYGAAIFTFLFRWAGATPIEGLKFMVLASGSLGGIYMYRLTIKMSKNNIAVSLITAILFVFLPYRIFCALCRCAFAESIATALIPMVFYGAYSFLHDKKWHVEPYVAFAAGAILIILSHAFTGLITAIFGVIYVLFNIKGVIDNRKNYRALISIGSAVVIIVFCVLFYVLNSMHYSSSGIYNLSDAERQWTTYKHISEETARTYNFSGFLNLIYISQNEKAAYWVSGDSVSGLLFTSLLYFITMVIAIIVDFFLKNAKYSKWYRHPTVTAVAFILPLIFRVRAEVYLAVFISLVIYFFITYIVCKLPTSEEENAPLYKNIDLYYLGFSLLICLALLCLPTAWKLVPSILYQGQFAWRMWSITAFLFAMLVGLVLSRYQGKKVALVTGSVLACGLMTLTMGTMEKRIKYLKSPEYIIVEGGYRFAENTKFSGVQNEMVPQIFNQEQIRKNEKEYYPRYVPTYSNSLFTQIKKDLDSESGFFYDAESYYKPVFLEGAGDVSITKYNSPNNEFHVVITSETALVQFPQFYYDDYVMYSNGKSLGTAKNVDGLITFELKQGTYDTKLVFKASKGYRIGRPFFYLGLFSLVSGGVFGYIYRTKLMKEKDPEEKDQ